MQVINIYCLLVPRRSTGNMSMNNTNKLLVEMTEQTFLLSE